MSFTLAAVTCATSGTPRASVMRWCLDPALRRSVGFGPVFFPAHGADGAAVDDGPPLVETAAPTEFSEQRLMKLLPYPGALPLHQPALAGAARATAHLLRQHPRNARPQHEQNPGEDR